MVWRAIFAVLTKDLRSEWRSRAALNAIVLFSLSAPVALGFSLARQKLSPETLGGLLWTILFFAACIGLPRAFVKEEESGTAALLRLHFSSDAVLWGKFGGQLLLLLATQAATVPVFVLLLGAQISSPLLLLCILLGGDFGLALASTLLGAMAAQTRSRGALFPAIAAPILLPLLATLSVASAAAFGADVEWLQPLQFVAVFDVALVAAAVMLFDFVWR